jgi:hypothetical protein
MSDNGRQKIDSELEKELAKYGDEVTGRAVSEYAAKGPRYDINVAFDRKEYLLSTTEITLGGMVSSAELGLASVNLLVSDELAEYWMNFVHDGATLSERLRFNASNARLVVNNTMTQHLRSKTTFTRLVKDFTAQNVSEGNLPAYLKDLQKAAEDYFIGPLPTKTQKKAFDAAVRRAERNIKRLVDSGASTSRLKSAYSQVLKATKKGDLEALQQKMDNAVQRKAIYNNQTVARTETARAYGQSIAREAEEIGANFIEWELSDAHPKPDECDLYANANAFGVGKGIWPVDAAPPYPAHPNCKCIANPVIKRVDDKRRVRYSEERVEKELKRMPEGKQKKLVGVDGKLIVEDVKGYGQPKKMRPLPKKYVEAKAAP